MITKDKNKMSMLLKSLARNETTIANKKTLLKDIEQWGNEKEIMLLD